MYTYSWTVKYTEITFPFIGKVTNTNNNYLFNLVIPGRNTHVKKIKILYHWISIRLSHIWITLLVLEKIWSCNIFNESVSDHEFTTVFKIVYDHMDIGYDIRWVATDKYRFVINSQQWQHGWVGLSRRHTLSPGRWFESHSEPFIFYIFFLSLFTVMVSVSINYIFQ